jgi:hypothetical protein
MGREDSQLSNEDKQGCLGAILQALGLAPKASEMEALPYRIRDDFLSPAERSYYHVLRVAAGDWAIVCPKVSLADLFYVKTGNHGTNTSYTNRIARKHIDFLLCDPQSLKPLLGIELDDSSHSRAARKQRDDFIEQVFAVAGLQLLRQPVQATYDVRVLGSALRSLTGRDQQTAAQVSPSPTVQGLVDASVPQAESLDQPAEAPSEASPSPESPPLCPKCGEMMVLRTAKRDGPHKGSQFWGCASYPRCHGIRELAAEDRS